MTNGCELHAGQARGDLCVGGRECVTLRLNRALEVSTGKLMRNNKKTLVRILLVAGAIATPIIYAYEYGPDPGYSGAPGDNASGCIASGCHVGTPNSGGGSIKISLAGGATTYVPGGPPVTISVTVADSKMKGFGFQLSSRVDSSPKTTPAGLLTPGSDGYTQVLCADGSSPTATGCPAKTGATLEWVEHTQTGWNKSGATPGSYTFSFSWTPPATNVGTVTLYAAGNAVPSPTVASVPTGTNTYLSSLQLSPGAATTNPNAPTITSGGINPLNSASTTIQPGAWSQIFGTNLAPALTVWKGDFATTLAGTSVTVNGKPASIYFVSPTQINFQAPNDTATGSVPVVVTTANGSVTSTVTLGSVGPSFLLLDGKHVTGIILRSDGSGAFGGGSYDILGPTGSSLGYPTVAAKAGDSVELYAVGFGPTSPQMPSGQALAAGQYGTATDQIQLVINGKTVTPSFAGITLAGLYQINLTVPAGLGTGDVSLLGTVAGAQTPAGFVMSLQ